MKFITVMSKLCLEKIVDLAKVFSKFMMMNMMISVPFSPISENLFHIFAKFDANVSTVHSPKQCKKRVKRPRWPPCAEF